MEGRRQKSEARSQYAPGSGEEDRIFGFLGWLSERKGLSVGLGAITEIPRCVRDEYMKRASGWLSHHLAHRIALANGQNGGAYE
jgi:hypothetical protein